MKSNRVLGARGMVLIAAFAMGTFARASPPSGVPLSIDGSLTMAGTPEANEEAMAALTSGGGAEIGGISHAAPATPKPTIFVLVGLTLAVLPLIRKRRS